MSSMGWAASYLFHYTITGYPCALESHVPELPTAIRQFCALSDRIGPGRLAWRYDPIIFSNLTPPGEHARHFCGDRPATGGARRSVW